MTAPPRVSVVTVYYNRRDHVTESIQSLLAQTYPEIEIIAVDDGSTDGTGAALEAITDPRYRVVRQANTGFTPAINAAIRASRGDYVAVHGSGDISFPERIAKQAAFLDAHPDVGVVGCFVEDEQEATGETQVFAPDDASRTRAGLMTRNAFTHGEVMYRRALYEAVGGYRPLFRYAQDHDLWLRMSALARLAAVPEVLYRRRKMAGGVSTSPDKLLLQHHLSDFAVQCARAVDAGEPDPIQRLGAQALLMRQRSPALARRLMSEGLKWMQRGQLPEGRALVAAAVAEAPSLRIRLAQMLALASRSPWLWHKVFAPLLRRRSGIVAWQGAEPMRRPAGQT